MMHLATKKFDIRIIALVFCLVTATIVLSGCGGSSETELQRLVRQSNCTTADQIYSDYQNNEVAAQQKYQDRVNRVCGVVEEIELNLFNDPIISLKVSGWGSVGIGGIDPALAANISKGSLAVFECSKINELLGNPVMMECRLAPAHNVPDEAQSESEQMIQNEPATEAAGTTVNGADRKGQALLKQLVGKWYCETFGEKSNGAKVVITISDNGWNLADTDVNPFELRSEHQGPVKIIGNVDEIFTEIELTNLNSSPPSGKWVIYKNEEVSLGWISFGGEGSENKCERM